MNKLQSLTIASALLAFSIGASAAKPTAITFDADATAPDGSEYARYLVKCSNGSVQPLTAWDGRKKWCVGSDSTDNCHKKQIKAAKKACKA